MSCVVRISMVSRLSDVQRSAANRRMVVSTAKPSRFFERDGDIDDDGGSPSASLPTLTVGSNIRNESLQELDVAIAQWKWR